MRFTLNLLLCSAFFSSTLFAQKPELKVKFGKISDEEMSMKSYKDDPAAPAVVLFDKGNISHRYVNNVGFIIEFERHVRIKIFNKEAYSLADVAIFYSTNEKVQELKAVSYNLENGKIVETKLDKENIFDEKLTRSLSVKKITIPAVREGSVIEYTYTVVVEKAVGFPVNGWVFQRTNVPTVWSEFEASVPTFIEYQKMSQGWVPFLLAEESKENKSLNINWIDRSDGPAISSTSRNVKVEYLVNTMHFIQENVPALKPEPFISSPKDYLSQINFDIRAVYQATLVPTGASYSLVNGLYTERNNTWERLGEEMLEDVYEDVLKSSKRTEADAAKCVAGKTTAAEKTAAIYEFIGKNYQSGGFDYYPRMSQSLENLVKNRKGTPTDLNLLFINMLRRVNINAYPVLISTRKNGIVLSFRVSADAFDRVIAAVETEEGAPILIDAAGWPNPLGLLPEEDLNGQGLLLKDKKSVSWVPLQNKVPARRAVAADLALKPEGGLSGAVSFSENGYGAVEARVKIKEKDAQTYVRERFKELVADGTFTGLNIENTENWQEQGLKGTFNIATSAFANVSGDKIYLTPSLGFGLKENPFKNPERKFNIDLGTPRSWTFSFVFKIPAGYKVEEAPKSAKMIFGENALSFDYFTETNPEQVKITIRQSIKKPYITIDVYEDLRQFYGTLVAKLEEQVVLTKI